MTPVDPNGSRFMGMGVADAATILGISHWATVGWLNKHGYRLREGKVTKAELPEDVERRIADRMAAAPPSAPCFRCGAARHCEHRPRSVAA